MVPTALISSEEHFTLILVVASRKVYEYKRKYLCHFFFIKHSPALGWKIIKCKTMEINKRGLNIWIFNWWSASRPDAPHHIKTYIKLLEGRAAMRKIFEFVSVLLSLSVIWQAIWLPTGRRWFNYIQELYQYALNENTLSIRVINCTYALRLKNNSLWAGDHTRHLPRPIIAGVYYSAGLRDIPTDTAQNFKTNNSHFLV